MATTPQFGNSTWSTAEKEAIQKLLEAKMGLEKVEFRPGPAQKTLVYTATSQIIEEVNSIFGPDGWSSSVTNLSQDFLDSEDGKFTCGCSAIVKITLKNGTYHEDLGYGVARKQPTEAKAIETAKKTAVSDGLKRALRQFGHALGNCLSSESYQQKLLKEQSGQSFQPKTPIQQQQTSKSPLNTPSHHNTPVNQTTPQQIIVPKQTSPSAPTLQPNIPTHTKTESNSNQNPITAIKAPSFAQDQNIFSGNHSLKRDGPNLVAPSPKRFQTETVRNLAPK